MAEMATIPKAYLEALEAEHAVLMGINFNYHLHEIDRDAIVAARRTVMDAKPKPPTAEDVLREMVRQVENGHIISIANVVVADARAALAAHDKA